MAGGCKRTILINIAAVLSSSVWMCIAARAAELVTLRNGFSVTCASHRQVAPEVLRLFLATSTGPANESYMDVALASIGFIEVIAPTHNTAAEAASPAAPSAPSITSLLQRSGSAHNVNAVLLASVVRAESAGNARAISARGARGLMQLMPGTAAQFGVSDSFAPEQNLDGGSAYLDYLLTRYHDRVDLALAAYNAGPAAVDRYHGVPPFRETRLYVARVVREFNRLARGEATAASSSVITMLPGTSR